MKNRIIGLGIATVITVLLGLLVNYLALPAWSLTSGDSWGYVWIMAIIGSLSFGIAEYVTDEDERFIVIKAVSIITGIILLTIIIILLIGSKMFHAGHY